jgi:hypothetical protein
VNLDFSAFYDHLMPQLPGCTTALVDLELREAAREFCEVTACWRVDLTIGTTADEPTYDVSEPEQNSEVVRIVRVTLLGALLWDAAWREPRRHRLDTSSDEVPKYSRAAPPFSMNADNTELTLIDDEVPASTDADGLELVVAIKPSITSTVLPRMLRDQHLQAMRTGTLARLMRMGKKPWTDRELSAFYEGEFVRLKSLAAHNAQQGNAGARLRTGKTGI